MKPKIKHLQNPPNFKDHSSRADLVAALSGLIKKSFSLFSFLGLWSKRDLTIKLYRIFYRKVQLGTKIKLLFLPWKWIFPLFPTKRKNGHVESGTPLKTTMFAVYLGHDNEWIAEWGNRILAYPVQCNGPSGKRFFEPHPRLSQIPLEFIWLWS